MSFVYFMVFVIFILPTLIIILSIISQKGKKIEKLAQQKKYVEAKALEEQRYQADLKYKQEVLEQMKLNNNKV